MMLPPVSEIEAALNALSKFGVVRTLKIGGVASDPIEVEFFAPPAPQVLSEPSESGQATAPAAAPAYATPAQSGNSDELKQPDIFDVLGSGSPIPGAPDRGAISGSQ